MGADCKTINMQSRHGQQFPTKSAVTCKATVMPVAMLGLIPSAHEMETMEIVFLCVQERPGNETSYTYESSELSFAYIASH